MGARFMAVSALRADLGVTARTEGLAVSDHRHPDAVEAFLAELGADGHPVVVTCSAADADRVRRVLAHARVRLPRLVATLEVVEGSPLSLGVISTLSENYGDGSAEALALQLAALDTLRQHQWSAVWTPTVSDLEDPSPGMANHLRSVLHLGGFLIEFTQPARVRSTSRSSLPPLPTMSDATLFHTHDATGWVLGAARSALTATSVIEQSSLRDPVDSFGSASAVELLAISDQLDDEIDRLASRAIDCPACGAHHARSSCPFCKMVSSTPESLSPQGGVNA